MTKIPFYSNSSQDILQTKHSELFHFKYFVYNKNKLEKFITNIFFFFFFFNSSSKTTTNRFVLPVLPLALLFSGYSLAKLSQQQHSSNKKSNKNKSFWKIKPALFFLLVTNIPMALYMTMVHQVHLLL